MTEKTTISRPRRSTPAGAAPRTTRALLLCGVLAGPLYMAIGLAQAFTRAGFDIGRHPFSLLSNGPLGWIQIGNFLTTGLMTLACAIGARRVLRGRPGGTWGPRLVGVFGTGLIVAGAFRADPADGFPPGTPDGPGEVTGSGVLHMVGFGVGFLCLTVACFVVARGLGALGQRRSARYSRIGGAAIPAAVVVSFATAGSTVALVALYAAVILAWTWLSTIAFRLHHISSTSPS